MPTMSTTMTLAFFLHLAGVLTVTAVGLTYLLRQRFMPYHTVALGCSWESLPPANRTLILALMRGAGGALYAMQTVANDTPARPPRGLVLGGIACSLAGFALSLAG